MTEGIVHPSHLLSVGEVLWGILLIAVTMAIHAFGMLMTLAASRGLWRRWPPRSGVFAGVRVLILASWMIVLVHLVEVIVWALFLLWRDAMPSATDAFYFTLLQYVTVGSDLTLPERWRLLGGMIAMAGLLTFAWSTTVLLALAQRFEDAQLRSHRRDRQAAAASDSGPKPPDVRDG
jgi:hypothetical protein